MCSAISPLASKPWRPATPCSTAPGIPIDDGGARQASPPGLVRRLSRAPTHFHPSSHTPLASASNFSVASRTSCPHRCVKPHLSPHEAPKGPPATAGNARSTMADPISAPGANTLLSVLGRGCIGRLVLSSSAHLVLGLPDPLRYRSSACASPGTLLTLASPDPCATHCAECRGYAVSAKCNCTTDSTARHQRRAPEDGC